METNNHYGKLEILNWYALHVRSRHEFKVKARLEGAGVDVFLPSVDKIRKWKDRKKTVSFPLFPGYIFVGVGDGGHERLAVLKTPGVVGFVGQSGGVPEVVPKDQVISLMKLVGNRESLDPYPYLKHGNRVRIKTGPLTGVEGILVNRKGFHLLVLSVDILKQGVSIQVDADSVEAL